MTAPSTIKPTRTTTPVGIPGLVDAEILASQLVWTLWQIAEHTEPDWFAKMGLIDALESAKDAQHRITSIQMREGR